MIWSRTRRGLVVLAVAAFAAGCAGSASPRESRSTEFLSTAEIEGSGYSDAFSVVQALRPQWLWTRGTTSINQQETIKIYLDGSLLGGPEYLRQITVRSIASMRHMDALEATNRWGLDHGLGAIIVSSRRQ